MKYCVIINNKRYEVEVEKGKGTIVNTNDIKLPIDENKNSSNEQVAVTTMMSKRIEGTEKKVIKAPMAGRVIDIKVEAGAVVKSGDTLLILEAMKMENEITAHVEGIVAEIKVNEKDIVSSGDVLMILK